MTSNIIKIHLTYRTIIIFSSKTLYFEVCRAHNLLHLGFTLRTIHFRHFSPPKHQFFTNFFTFWTFELNNQIITSRKKELWQPETAANDFQLPLGKETEKGIDKQSRKEKEIKPTLKYPLGFCKDRPYSCFFDLTS